MNSIPRHNSARRAPSTFLARLAKEFRRQRDRARLENAWKRLTNGCARCSHGPVIETCWQCVVDLRGAP
jgi:hypothetical protein